MIKLNKRWAAVAAFSVSTFCAVLLPLPVPVINNQLFFTADDKIMRQTLIICPFLSFYLVAKGIMTSYLYIMTVYAYLL